MAVVNTKSTVITNSDATPPTLNDAVLNGRARHVAAAVEVSAADDDTSVYRMFRVHSSERVERLEVLNDAITSGTDYDLGLYRTAADGGAVVDADLFASAVTMASARIPPLDLTFEALDVAKIEKPIWELLGLSADPGVFYDVCFTGNTVGTAAGTISLRGVIVGSRA